MELASPKPTFDMLIVGNYFCDVVFTDLPSFPALGQEIYSRGLTVIPGGGAYNTAVALRRLNVDVGWAGTLGNDFFSQFVDHALHTEGVDTRLIERLDRPLRRVTVALSYPADRAFVSFTDESGTSADLALRALDQAESKHLHFPGLTLDSRLPALFDQCHARGMSISMDCQHRDVTLDSPLVRDTLTRLDVFMPNAAEAQRLTGTTTLAEAQRLLCDLVPCLVIKNGGEGVVGWQDGETLTIPAHPVTVVDTTGAGDTFNAGFLAGRLAGYPFERCLQWGNFCGAKSVQGVGGSSTAPFWEVLVANFGDR